MCIVVYVYCIISQCLSDATRISNNTAEQEQMNRQRDKLNSKLVENINSVNKPEPEVSQVKEFKCKFENEKNASAGNRTRVNCLEGSYAHHYTTDAW